MSENATEKSCVVVPAYQEQGRIGSVVVEIRKHGADVVVVDDGSTDLTAEEARKAGAVVIRHEANKGKGAALATGFEYARSHGVGVVITMDADGQHAPSDLPAFLEAYRGTGCPVIVGNRMGTTGAMPLIRRLTNRYMSWLLSRRIGQHVPDTQCGFRLFRTDVIPALSGASTRFAAESEILIELGDRGVRSGAVPIQVIYGDEKSKINPLRDTIRFFKMLRRHRNRREKRKDGDHGTTD